MAAITRRIGERMSIEWARQGPFDRSSINLPGDGELVEHIPVHVDEARAKEIVVRVDHHGALDAQSTQIRASALRLGAFRVGEGLLDMRGVA